MSEQEKKQNTVAEVLVKCLENEGVKYVFGIPGEENLDMMNALEKSDIRVIVVRHEQGAAFMADSRCVFLNVGPRCHEPDHRHGRC